METAINNKTHWVTEITAPQLNNTNIWTKWLALTDSQVPSKTLWYMVSLIAQGVLFLPLPAALIYYYNAPVMILAITLILYFANIIAGMGGSNIRVTLTLFAASIIIHILMLVVFIL
ncbi:MAG: hypothetical protein V4592_09580 [Bacteroidota bacterium]